MKKDVIHSYLQQNGGWPTMAKNTQYIFPLNSLVFVCPKSPNPEFHFPSLPSFHWGTLDSSIKARNRKASLTIS